VELLLAGLARQTRQLEVVGVNDGIADVTFLDSLILSVEISFPQRNSIVESAVLLVKEKFC